jgi:hypothetical protein
MKTALPADDSPLERWRKRLAELEAISKPTFADRLYMQTARVVVSDLELWVQQVESEEQ